MAVSVDTVYQKVLALANKEQRGYITPHDFNLFANLAQKEIFEQYFYDLNIARRNQGNETFYADIDDILEEKLQVFERSDGSAAVTAYTGAGGGGINKILPNYIYKVTRIEFNNANCEILSTKDFNNARNNRLLQPSNSRPIVNIRGGVMRCVGSNNTNITPTGVFYFKNLEKVNWTYVVINKRAMYSAQASTQDFELHGSEENELVDKILKFAGLSNKQQDITQAGQGMESIRKQQQPKI
tara:strand:- start:588 stop:1310 length:723 start_codon:yes stop_codon:yes gene_type:complete